MTDKIEQIEGQVRDKVDSTVHQARQAMDLRHQVNERPWMAVGAAITLGFLVGSMGGDDRPHYQPGQPMRYYPQSGHWSAEDRYSDSQSYSSHSGGHSGSHSGHQSHDRHSSGGMSNTMSHIAGPMREELSIMAVAAVRSAMRVLRESLQDSIPQFDNEYRAVQHEREDTGSKGYSSTDQRAAAVGEASTYSPSSTAARANEDAFRARQG